MTLHLDPTHLDAGRLAPVAPAMARLARTQPPVDPGLPHHDARALTDGGTLAAIGLDGQTYTLRITRQGKLILTK